MPRPGTDEQIKQKVWELVANYPKMGAGHIRSKLSAHFSASVLPTERTIARIKKAFLDREPSERIQYRHLAWPESFQSGALPWEASHAALELLRFCRERGWGRPMIGFAVWFWRLTLAAPGADLYSRFNAAAHCRLIEASVAPPPNVWEGPESYLLTAPWKSKKQAAAYKKAVDSGKLPALSPKGLKTGVGFMWEMISQFAGKERKK